MYCLYVVVWWYVVCVLSVDVVVCVCVCVCVFYRRCCRPVFLVILLCFVLCLCLFVVCGTVAGLCVVVM